jgi:hypothetical protein
MAATAVRAGKAMHEAEDPPNSIRLRKERVLICVKSRLRVAWELRL